jgi:NAD(P)-dependent dehydrogenase (short-subunit alcohol dehydrogenase family)
LADHSTKIHPVINQIAKIDASIDTKYFQVDLDSLSSVRNAARSILGDFSAPKIDVMINNAGIMVAPYGKTRDGLEMQFGVNHISHFLLTNLHMPKILAAGPSARIVNISSYGNIMSNILYEDVGFSDGQIYNPWFAYGQSKTANILMAVSLNQKLGENGIRAYALNPGSQYISLYEIVSKSLLIFWAGVPSALQRHFTPETVQLATDISKRLGIQRFNRKTQQQGCSTTIRAIIDPDLPSKSGLTGVKKVNNKINISFRRKCCLPTRLQLDGGPCSARALCDRPGEC